MPRISIILPTLRVGGLDVTFNGLAQQTFKDFELVLIDGIHKHRHELVREKASQYDFKVVHVEPFDNPFPVCSFCRYSNTGLVYATGELVVFITDYTWLPKNCLQMHVDAHQSYGPDSGSMGPHDYVLLPPFNSKFNPYTNPEIDKYVDDVTSGRYESLMWSLFEKEFDTDASQIDKDPPYINGDPKLKLPPGIVSGNFFHAKNDCCSLEAALAINGYDEDLDGTNTYQDMDFGERLCAKQSIKWHTDPNNIVYIVNPRPHFPWPLRLRPYDTNKGIFFGKRDAGFPSVNSWDLRTARLLKNWLA